jgi:large subunit ribosomal protein L22
MGKPKHERDLADHQAMAMARLLRSSPRKLNLVAQLIRGRKAGEAVNQLTFSRRGIARDVKKVLLSAIANAENNHDLDVDRLVVSEATVGKSLVMKRFRARARGRAGRIEKPFSRLRIVVEEREEEVALWDTRSIRSACAWGSIGPGTRAGTRTHSTVTCCSRTSRSATSCTSA